MACDQSSTCPQSIFTATNYNYFSSESRAKSDYSPFPNTLFSLSETNHSHSGKEEECQFYNGKGMRSPWNSVTHIRKSSPKPLKKETDFWLEYAQFFSKRQLCFLSFCFFLFFSPPLLFLNSFCRLVMKLEKYHLETYLLDTYPTCSHYLPS